jgi:Cu(I)/Ag(I) efflux system membrane fusion protein
MSHLDSPRGDHAGGAAWVRIGLGALVVAVLAAAVFFGVRYLRDGPAGPAMRSAGRLRLGVETVPRAPAVGENRLRVRVDDAGGEPLSGASVDAVVFMPAMGSMPYMESRPPLAETSPGLYEGKFRLAMGGSWDVRLHVRSTSGQEARADLRLTVGTPGLVWASEPEGEVADTGAAGPPAGAVRLSLRRRQEIGVTTAPVERRDLSHRRRVVGLVVPDETKLADVSLKFSGWVRRLEADFTGGTVRAGEVLFTIYSPELYAAEREFVEALAAAERLADPAARARAQELAAAARRRLELWDIGASEIADLERTRAPAAERPLRAPASGIVLEKSVVEGGRIESGATVYRIAPLDPIWVHAEVYSYELPLLAVGQPATVRLPHTDAPPLAGRVSYLYPSLAGESRTARVRIELPNPRLALRPEMFVDVDLEIPLPVSLAVPYTAVVVSGRRHLVFVDRGDGWLEPREVRLGLRAGEYYAVAEGLAEGEKVVTSGNFLLSAESRLQSATSRGAPEGEP